MVLASLLALIAIVAGPTPIAAAAATRAHGDALLVKQSATKTKAKKKKPAPTTIKMKLLGSVAPESPENGNQRRGWLYTDGARWAAYEPMAGTTRLIDTVTNKTIERPDPEGCADGLIAVDGGEILYSCEDPECPEHERSCPLPSNNTLASTRYVVEDIGSDEQHPVAGEDTLPNQSPEAGIGGLSEIGSQWAEGGIGTHVGAYQFFLNWRTGQLVLAEKEESETSVEDLGNPGLKQRLCKPITRPENKAEYKFSLYAPLQYEPPFAVVGPLDTSDPEADVPLQIRKCGSGKRVFPPSGGGVQLGARVLSWAGNGAYITPLYVKGREWHGPYYKLLGLPMGREVEGPLVQHTSSMVFVTVQTGLTPAQVYLARLPWARSTR